MKIWILCWRAGKKPKLKNDLLTFTNSERAVENYFGTKEFDPTDPEFRKYSLEFELKEENCIFRGGPGV